MTTQVTKELQKGDWVLIGTQTASNDVSLTQTGLDSTYDIFCVVCAGITITANGNGLFMRLGDSGGIDSGGSDYVGIRQKLVEGSTSYAAIDESGRDNLILADGTGTEPKGLSSITWIMNPGDAGTRNTLFTTYSMYSSVPQLEGGTNLGMREAAITLDRIQVIAQSGNIGSGRFTIWGLPHE